MCSYDEMSSKKGQSENFSVTQAFWSSTSNVRVYLKCSVTDFEWTMLSTK